MKKSIFILAAFVASVCTSCKKDYTCECSVNGVVTSTSTINTTKKDAKALCESTSYTGETCIIK